MSVYKKLSKARVIFQKSDVKKTGHNKFSNYYYFELADIMPRINEICDELGLFGFVSFGKEISVLKICCVDDPKTFVRIKTPMAEANLKGCHPIQNLGAAESYIRRYLWVAAFEIVEHDALDSSAPIKNTEEPKYLKAVKYLNSKGISDGEICLYFNISLVSQLDDDHFESIRDMIKSDSILDAFKNRIK